MDELLETEYPLEAVHARFLGRTAPFHGLEVDSHDVNLNVGRLLLFLLNEQLLPRRLDGARTFADAAVQMSSCDCIADSVTGDDGLWGVCLPNWAGGRCIGLETDDIVGTCQGSGMVLGGILADLIGDLAADSRLTREGAAWLLEDDSDLQVDRLERGQWSGSVHRGEDDRPWEGAFRGDRPAP